MEKKYYKTISLKSWEDFIKDIASKTRLEWIFIGQSNADWDLKTSLERANIVSSFPSYEEEYLNEFKRGAKFYLKDEELPSTQLEWFSMIQHFGAPSRLLDFTKSPYIAAFFAFERANPQDEAVAIWVLNKNFLYQQALYFFKDKNISISSTSHYTFDDNTFERVFLKSLEEDFDCVFPIESKQINQRYFLQQALFLCQGNPEKPIIEQLEFISKDILHETIIKVIIPISEKKKVLQDLLKMNISPASLFPGLDGFAQSLWMKYSNSWTLGETGVLLENAQRIGMA